MIFFNVPQAKKQLVEFGLVYTLRSSFRGTGKTTAVSGPYPGGEFLGFVNVVWVREIIHPDDLYPYVHHSGFSSVDDWLVAATPSSQTLYRVEKVSNEEMK